jgi:hypothetical protein
MLVLAAAVAIAPADTAAHHGKKEEHAQPATARGGCVWTGGGTRYASLADCMKGGRAKRSCRRICQ